MIYWTITYFAHFLSALGLNLFGVGVVVSLDDEGVVRLRVEDKLPWGVLK